MRPQKLRIFFSRERALAQRVVSPVGAMLFKASKPTLEGRCPATATISRTTSSGTTTMMPGSPSGAFLTHPLGLLH